MDQGRIITSVKSFKASTCKNDNRHERLPASVLGTVFRCLALGFIQVCYGFFAWGYIGYVQNQRAAVFERLRLRDLPFSADFHFQSLAAQPESRSERGLKQAQNTLDPPCSPYVHPSINHITFGNMLINLCAQVMFSQDPSVYS